MADFKDRLLRLVKTFGIFTVAAVGILLIILLIGINDTMFTVESDSEALILRFGKYDRTLQPGLRFKLPFVEEDFHVATQKQYKEEFGFRTTKAAAKSEFSTDDFRREAEMLTADRNIVNIQWSTQYQIVDAKKWLFAVRGARETFRDLNEAAFRKVVGDSPETYVLTDGRSELAEKVAAELQARSEHYNLGIRTDSVLIRSATPPAEVTPAYNEVNEAEQERSEKINNARKAYNDVIPRARGLADQTIKQAQGYSVERINEAQGNVARFNALLKEYKLAPEITKQRMYYETLERILPKIQQKVVVESSVKGLLPLLNLTPKTSNPIAE